MSSSNAGPPQSSSQAGVDAVLRYTGIPRSWLKRPKLPSRNWLIFLGTASSLIGLYAYDRHKCKEIRQAYIDRVKDIAEQPVQPLDAPRKVTVYGSKWPGDDDHRRSIQFFKKFVKPILVAAAVDYDIVSGQRHGELATRIANEIKSRRRIDVGLDQPPLNLLPMLKQPTPEEQAQMELEGGSIIIGRQTFKEYMAGIRRGWTDTLEIVDSEEALSRELESDGRFDEPEEDNSSVNNLDDEPIPTPSRLIPSQNSHLFSSLNPALKHTQSGQNAEVEVIPWSLNAPPSTIPPFPPLLLVPFTNYVGFTRIPLMIYDFFNERAKVQIGSEAAYRLIEANHRPLLVPPPQEWHALSEPQLATGSASQDDLDFDRQAESYYKRSVHKIPADIQKAREEYYKQLPKKLETARALARGTREPTKDEKEFPPPTEAMIRAERMKKELRWRSDAAGWEIVKPDADVAWDERFRTTLRIYVDKPNEDSRSEFR